MMTPQEVSEHAFAKSSFGGYNMVMVDEFLDRLTVDYTALYKENASLKAKMKVLADSLEEYRATEKGMRRALLAAQQAADEMVKDAEVRKAELIRAAEMEAQVKINELRRQVLDEEVRLETVQKGTAEYVEKIRAACLKQAECLENLSQITAATPKVPPMTTSIDMTAQAIEQSVQKLISQDDEGEQLQLELEEQPTHIEPEDEGEDFPLDSNPFDDEPVRSRRDQERARGFEPEDDDEDEDDEDANRPTRRIDFDNLQFGSNYELK